MVKVSYTEQKTTPCKKNIKLDGIYVENLRFVDETGDITQVVLDEIPENVQQVSFKITIELPPGED